MKTMINYNDISNENITFLKDINKHVNFSLNGEFKYCTIKNLDVRILGGFIDGLTQGSIYTVIPFVSTSLLIGDPFLVLSRQFLVTKHSSYEIVNKYCRDQFNIAISQFNLDLDKPNT